MAMPSTHQLVLFALSAFVLIVIPGPSVLFVVGRALVHGRAGGLLSVLGNALGIMPLVVAVALGIGAVISASAIAFTVIKVLGAAYLAYLGVQAIRHRKDGVGDTTSEVTRAQPWTLLAQGFIVGITNPKSIVFLAAALPQFVDVTQGSAQLQMLMLGAVFTTIGLLSDSTWALLAGTARGWFAKSPRRLVRIRATGGVMMIGLSGVLLSSGSKH